MEKISKPENLTIYRKKWLTVLGGIVYLLLAAALVAIVSVAYVKTDEATLRELKTVMIGSVVGVCICSFILLIYSVLCFNNLRYPVILATDEKGIYDYSGFMHGGFVPWNDVHRIYGLSCPAVSANGGAPNYRANLNDSAFTKRSLPYPYTAMDDAERITGNAGKMENLADLLVDGPAPIVRIELKNYKATFANRSKIWRIIFFLSNFGCLRIRTFCSPISKRETYAVLAERLIYYTATEN